MYMIYKDLSMNMYICMCVCMYVCMQPFNSIKHFQSQSKGNDGREKQLSWDKKKEITVTRAVSMMFQKERRLMRETEVPERNQTHSLPMIACHLVEGRLRSTFFHPYSEWQSQSSTSFHSDSSLFQVNWRSCPLWKQKTKPKSNKKATLFQ